jgi:lysozyme family protein
MTRFEECLALVLGHEGGYSNHAADKGGATSSGITQAVYDEWRAGRGFGRQPVLDISADEVKMIYKARYWLLGKCDQLPAPLDYVHFDGCVNHGPGQAAKFLQRALCVAADGVVGPKTLAAVREDDAAGRIEDICANILDQREEFYHRLVEKDPTQKAFIRGWLNRIVAVRGKSMA